eukprot:c23320_g1_i2 orf=131-1051(-)
MMSFRGFLEGGLASIVAGCSTHPFDVIKVRMQLEGEAVAAAAFLAHSTSCSAYNGPSPISIGMRLVQTEGFQGLFCGVSATILRQTLYSTTRMGLYQLLKRHWREPAVQGGLPLFKKVAAGLIAGGVGAVVGNPADVAMVRMQADGFLPPSERRNYTSVVDALVTMVKQEGLESLWTGSSLTVQRAMVVTACQLAAYDQIKESLSRSGVLGQGLVLYMVASFCAGLAASVASTPIDVVRTRIMNMKVEPGRPRPYSSPLDCAVKTVKQEGGLALYKGFLPTLTRQGPFTIVLFLTLEQIRRLMKDL